MSSVWPGFCVAGTADIWLHGLTSPGAGGFAQQGVLQRSSVRGGRMEG